MALSSTATRIAYTGNGVTTSFAYPFRILDASHLVVSINGVTQTSGFSVTGVNNPAGGSVVFSVAPTVGASIVLSRSLPLTQPVDTVNNETILEDVIDTALDRATMQIQQTDAKVERAFRLADSDPYSGSLSLPQTPVRLGGFLYFNPTTGAPEIAQPVGALAVNNVAPSVQNFSGTGSQTIFTLSAGVPSSLLTYVFISGVYQQKDRYTINGTALSFTAAPPAGTNNIEVVTLPSYAVAGGVAAAGIIDSGVVGRALLVAATVAAARGALGLGTADTAQFARIEAGDTHFNMRLVSGAPRMNLDTNDYWTFNRTAHLLELLLNDTARLQIDETSFTLPGKINIGADNVLRADSGFGSLGAAYLPRAWVNFSGVALSGTYSRTGTLVTVTMTAHGMTTGQRVNLDFTTGTATDGNYVVTVTGVDTFTVNDTASGATSGNVTRVTWIRAGGNVASVTRSAAGMYLVTFASAMPDANYAVNVTANSDNADAPPLVGGTWMRVFPTNPAAGSVSIGTIDATGAAFTDAPYVGVTVLR